MIERARFRKEVQKEKKERKILLNEENINESVR